MQQCGQPVDKSPGYVVVLQEYNTRCSGATNCRGPGAARLAFAKLAHTPQVCRQLPIKVDTPLLN